MDDQQLEAAYEQAVSNMWVRQIKELGAAIDARQAARERRLSAPGALADAALWYASAGVPVFPCRPRAKAPLLRAAHKAVPESATCKGECGRLGHGLHDATTDLDQVRAWWAATPAANIGTPTGIHWDVIDVDGPAGYAAIGLLAEAGLLPPLLAKAHTPGDSTADPVRPRGAHYYIAATGDGNAASGKVLPEGLDYRGLGGYVLAAPSVGPDGNRYEWITAPAPALVVAG